MFRAILFDKDGTLTDFRATWQAWMPGAIHDLARDSGAGPDAIADAFGYDLARSRIRDDGLFVTAPGPVVEELVGNRIGWSPSRLADWLGPRQATVEQIPVPDTGAVLSRLRRAGLPLGVLTNAGEAEATRHLEHLGIARFFDRVIGCDSGFGAKPDPAGAAAFADGLGFSRGEVLLVGDGLTDMAAARGAGLASVAVLTGTLCAEVLGREALAVLPDVSHLPDWLEGRGQRIPLT